VPGDADRAAAVVGPHGPDPHSATFVWQKMTVLGAAFG
jgi:hypothetical protein